MKKLLSVTAICVAVTFAVLPLASAQDRAAPPSQAADKVFEGQLTKVDANAKQITLKGTDAEMMFEYTDATQVIGADKGVQGLATRTGTPLKITYRDSQGKHIATRIETLEKR